MPASLAIHRLSARTPARAQPVAARLALQALGADLEDAMPRSLPPQALLWLRRLQLQAPEAALLRPAPGAWRQDWIAAGRTLLDAALAQAARPALGPVPDSANAVLFADAAEMLACLALAAQRGQLDRWWWRGLLGLAWPAWQRAWAARPQAQAAAQRLLVRMGQGAAAAMWQGDDVAMARADAPLPRPAGREGLPPAQVTPAVQATATELPQWSSPDEPAPSSVRAPLQEKPAPDVAATQERGAWPEPMPTSSPPRVSAVDGPTPRDAVAHVAATSLPRSAAGGAVDQRATFSSTSAAGVPSAHAAPSAMRPVVDVPHRGRAAAARETPPADSRPEGPAAVALPGQAMEVPAAEAEPSRTVTRPRSEASGPTTPGGVVPDRAPASRPAAVRARARRSDPPQTQEPPIDSAAVWPWPQAVASRQAPLLFLVNALLEDGLYPDFTRPRDPGVPVPLWVLLAELARAWRLPADPLHVALRQRCTDWTIPAEMPAVPGAVAGPWAEWLPAYARTLRRRLCRRLQLRVAAWPQALTLARPARLWLSEAEWVAEFDLDGHDVAWRLAGLDRDPGWLPSTGCSLRFVFV